MPNIKNHFLCAPLIIHTILLCLIISPNIFADNPPITNLSSHQSRIIEPPHYRLSDYRSRVPDTLQNGTVIHSVENLNTLISQAKPLLIDVYPAPQKPAGLSDSEFWIEPSRSTIPNSVWLANVGMGKLSTNTDNFFRNTLASLSFNNKNTPLVFFCEPDCWHSWNAAKRAINYGYTSVYWFRSGISQWQAAGQSLQTSKPLRPTANHSIPSKLSFKKIADGVYTYIGSIDEILTAPYGMVANISFIVGEKSIAVIDTGSSFNQGQLVHQAIRAVSHLPISHIINTHVHPDHIFGNAAFVSNKPNSKKPEFIAHKGFIKDFYNRAPHYLARLKKESINQSWYKNTRAIKPTKFIRQPNKINLGGRSLLLTPHNAAHTRHDLSVFDEKTATLITGDLVFEQHCPALDGSIVGWLNTLSELKKIHYKRLIPGHGKILFHKDQSAQEAIQKQVHYLTGLLKSVRSSIASQTDIYTASTSLMLEHKPNWLLFDAFHRRNIIQAYKELEWE